LVSFTALFLPIWWSWIGTTFYATRFVAADDLIYRALTAMAPTVQYVVTNPPGSALSTSVRWLICRALAACLATIGAIHWTSAAPAQRALDRARTRLRVLASLLILILAVAGAHLSAVFLIGILAMICVAQVLIDLRNDSAITRHGEADPPDEGA
jgi:hypothetical protein